MTTRAARDLSSVGPGLTFEPAIYSRISKDTEDTRLGVERQEQDCRKLCADRGWSVAGVYCDNDISAADPKKKRPEYERLLKDIATGQVNAVAVYSRIGFTGVRAELESFVTACDTAGLTNWLRSAVIST